MNGLEANDLQLNLADLYIQLGEYQHAAKIIASIRPLTFQSILEIVKLALVKNDSEAALTYCDRLAKVSNTVDEKILATMLKCKCLLLRKEARKALNILQNTMAHFENDETTTEIVRFY
ncbi:unnamed protein product [Onchocerca flexuosa]|uniref:TPR_REGION domain-containing protein n=1 Tax=Onchocerca flexuosa TaxID=387005 RepID=A0A183HTV0_9BILA|nr:unnamed protein product [Onchocerca flexuosa]